MNQIPNFEAVVRRYLDWLDGDAESPILSLYKMKVLYGARTTHTEINRQMDKRADGE